MLPLQIIQLNLKCHATLCKDLWKKAVHATPLVKYLHFLGDATSQQIQIKLSVMLRFVKFCVNSSSCYSWVQKPASINSCYPCNSSITFSVSCYLCLKLNNKLDHATSTHYSIKPKGSCYPSQWLMKKISSCYLLVKYLHFWGDATPQQNQIKLSVMLPFVKFCENSTSCYSWVQNSASINSCYPPL